MENNANLEYIFKSVNTNDKELLDSYLESIMEVKDNTNIWLESKEVNIPIWSSDYPNKDVFKEDLETSLNTIGIFTSSDNKLVGYVTYYDAKSHYNEEYKNELINDISKRNKDIDPYPFKKLDNFKDTNVIVIFRLMVDPKYNSKGLGKMLMNKAKEEVINLNMTITNNNNNKYSYLGLLCHPSNYIAKKMYLKLGYKYLETINFIYGPYEIYVYKLD